MMKTRSKNSKRAIKKTRIDLLPTSKLHNSSARNISECFNSKATVTVEKGLCSNCSVYFTKKEYGIASIFIDKKTPNISNQTALAFIFETNGRMNEDGTLSSAFLHAERHLNYNFVLCLQCSLSLKMLYKAFKHFTELCSLDSMIFKTLDKISILRNTTDLNQTNLLDSDQLQSLNVKIEAESHKLTEKENSNHFSEFPFSDNDKEIISKDHINIEDKFMYTKDEGIYVKLERSTQNVKRDNSEYDSSGSDKSFNSDSPEEGEGNEQDSISSSSDDEEYSPSETVKARGSNRGKTVNRNSVGGLKLKTNAQINDKTPATEIKRCTYCWKSFKCRTSFRRHVRIHTTEDDAKLTCTMCSKKFSRESHLATHISKMHNPSPKSSQSAEKVKLTKEKKFEPSAIPYTCQVCSTSYTRKTRLLKHQKRVHTVSSNVNVDFLAIFDMFPPGGAVTTIGETLSCTLCLKLYSRRDRLAAHMLIHAQETPFSCTVCGKKFLIETSLTNHMVLHDESNPFECDICKRRFTRTDFLKRHMANCNMDSDGNVLELDKFPCDQCEKKFKRLDFLRAHRVVHNEEKSFLCDKCGKCFSRSDNLLQHRRSHVNKKKHACSVCDENFDRVTQLREHESTVHSDQIPPRYVCQISGCAKIFKSSKILRHHGAVHTDKKDFSCNMCRKTFNRSNNLSTHIRSVHLQDPTVKRQRKSKSTTGNNNSTTEDDQNLFQQLGGMILQPPAAVLMQKEHRYDLTRHSENSPLSMSTHNNYALDDKDNTTHTIINI